MTFNEYLTSVDAQVKPVHLNMRQNKEHLTNIPENFIHVDIY